MIDHLASGGAEFLVAEFAAVAPAAAIELSIGTLRSTEQPSPAADRLRALGFEPHVTPVRSILSARDLRHVRRHLALMEPDILHTHLGSADMLGSLAARSLGIPSVATIHADWWSREPLERLRNSLMARARRHCAARVIAVSASARDAYLGARRDVPEHVVVVHNGISDRARPGSGAAVRRELGLPVDSLVALMASTLRPEKNYETAMDAVAVLRNRFPNLRLVIAGDGPHEPAVRQHAGRLGDAVVLPGHREDVMALLDASDVLLHPSYFDAFPTSLLEAMAASVPVVATRTGGMVEIVEHERTGILVAPPPTPERFARALAPVLERRELRVRLGAAGRRRFDGQFTALRWAERVRAVYDDVLAEAISSPRRPHARRRVPIRTGP